MTRDTSKTIGRRERRRIVDLTLPVDASMRGVEIRPTRLLSRDGWNATTLSLYSHAGTHMDAPRHFLADGATIDEQDLGACIGPAVVLDLTPVEPRELLDVERLSPWEERIVEGTRLLLRTDWSDYHGTEGYRDELPRISLELARWLVERRVALLGVEPPSVADVNNLAELTAVHRTLLGAGIVIVEGLCRLRELRSDVVEFIALPLPVLDGDGTPVRAVAVEQSPRRERRPAPRRGEE